MNSSKCMSFTGEMNRAAEKMNRGHKLKNKGITWQLGEEWSLTLAEEYCPELRARNVWASWGWRGVFSLGSQGLGTAVANSSGNPKELHRQMLAFFCRREHGRVNKALLCLPLFPGSLRGLGPAPHTFGKIKALRFVWWKANICPTFNVVRAAWAGSLDNAYFSRGNRPFLSSRRIVPP